MDNSISYLSLYETLKNSDSKVKDIPSCTNAEAVHFLMLYVCKTLGKDLEVLEGSDKEALSKKVRGFCSTLKCKWEKSRRIESHFLKLNGKWLEYCLQLPTLKNKSRSNDETPTSSRGRPLKDFENLSERSKRKRTEEIRSRVSPTELYHAASSSLFSEGKRAAASLLAEATRYSPKRPVKMQRFIRKAKTMKYPIPYTPEEAVASLIVEKGLTKKAYTDLRKELKQKNANVLPSYDNVLEAKKRCYPDGIIVNEYGATVPLQNLLDHTCNRILETLDIPSDFKLSEYEKTGLLVKWGCDGSSGQNEYMQHFTRAESEEEPSVHERNFSDKHVFMFSMVPLRLVCTSTGKEKIVIWENPKTSSVRYCRPMKFFYMKETKETTLHEVRKSEDEIRNLKPLVKVINGVEGRINYVMVLTMLDTKVISTLTQTGSSTCYICGCLPSQMNDLQRNSAFSIRQENLKYGLSDLHAWIKFLECILHIAYKLDLQKGNLRNTSAEEKQIVQERKSDVQESLWKTLGTKVDRVVQGTGTSNTGNVSRRFFRDPQKAAEATGVSADLISKFAVILQVLSSGHVIADDAFSAYAHDTAQLYVSLYKWYTMPPTVHKVLIHGAQAIRYALLPIGKLSEEAQESRNKDYRYFREHQTRKTSREDTTTDLMHTLLFSSDPVVSRYLNKPSIHWDELPTEVQALLVLDEEKEEESASEGEGDMELSD